MSLIPEVWWPSAVLALALLADVAMSLKPLAFIRACLNGVGFPEDWWWTLIVAKLLAVIGLVSGIWLPGVGFAANAGVVAYFLCAVAAHVRARFLGQAFWLNCLGMLALSIAALVLSLVL